MERTEQPTPKRLREAREEGQVPRSRDLNTLLLLLAASGGLLAFGGWLAGGLSRQMTDAFSRPRASLFDPLTLQPYLGQVLVDVLGTFAPLLLLLFLVALLAPMALGGWVFSPKALVPKLGKLDPVKGLGRIFSRRAPVEALKAFAKFAVVAVVSTLLLYQRADDLFALGSEPVRQGLAHMGSIIGWSFVGLSAVLILIAAVDVPFQLWDHTNKLKMTKQQVKDERKQTEGSPEVKGRIRAVQRQMAQQRMMQDIPTADVVVTNPTHYAVALRYDKEGADAPVVVAMGADLIAGEIRKVAAANDVPIVEAPPLARSLYYNCEIGGQIPAGLYVAVAQLLAYVYQLRAVHGPGQRPPEQPESFPIPDELQHQ
ncbi:MAG: flagellar biosynthesis protein FlhB [Thiohalobacterales bacterium]|nr:flagellar biosynthesis protein FlhB [Thiohalobacterales bacterium]